MIGRPGPDVPDYPVKVTTNHQLVIFAMVLGVWTWFMVMAVVLISALTWEVRS
jgi:hypothetical protein